MIDVKNTTPPAAIEVTIVLTGNDVFRLEALLNQHPDGGNANVAMLRDDLRAALAVAVVTS